MKKRLIKKIGIIFYILIMFTLLVHALTFITNFNEGIYVNTEYNDSAVILIGENLTGSYTSKIFDAGNISTWNNISWNGNNFGPSSLFCVDNGGDIYQSIDGGSVWEMSQEDYGRTTATIDMFSNLNYLYILSGTGNEVWRSADGTNFTLIYSGFDTKSPYVGDFDSNGNLYVVTAPGKIWKSIDNGEIWILQGDFNGDSTNDPKGITIDNNNYIYIVGAAGNIFKSVDEGVNWTKVNDGYGGSTGTDGMESDSSNNLYILLNTKIYKSSDAGVSWNVINDSISPYANTLVQIFIDDNNNLFILDAIGRVFKSANLGVSWIEVGDCNNEVTTNPKGITGFKQMASLDFQVRSCNDGACLGESWIDINDISPQNLSVNNNRYFQFKSYFETEDVNYSLQLYGVIIDYNLAGTPPQCDLEHLELCDNQQDCEDVGGYWYNDFCNEEPQPQENQAPIVTLINPSNGFNTQTQQITFSCSAIDTDGFEELKNITLYGNWGGGWHANETKSLTGTSNSTTFTKTLPYGTYVWNCLVYDNGSLGGWGDSDFTFVIFEESIGEFEEGSLVGEFSIAGEVPTDSNLEKGIIKQIIIGVIIGSLFVGMLVLLVYLIFKLSK